MKADLTISWFFLVEVSMVIRTICIRVVRVGPVHYGTAHYVQGIDVLCKLLQTTSGRVKVTLVLDPRCECHEVLEQSEVL